jgi:hypothetical protein
MSNPAITAVEVAPKTDNGIPKFQPTSGNPRADAMNNGINDSTRLNDLNKIAQGGARRRRKYHGGQANTGQGTTTGQTTTTLPPGPTPIYKDPSSGTPYSAQNQTTGAMTTTLNQNAEAQYDQVQLAPQVKTGGTRRKRRGGQKWGCYSGGKRKSRKHSKKSSRKSRKSRRK